MSKTDLLFEPLAIGGMMIKNRIVQTPVEVGMASFDGGPTKELTDYYLSRVRGGVGLICTGICRVDSIHGVTSPRQLSLATGRNAKAFREMTDRIHAGGGKIVVQLHHPGRQTYSALIGNWPLVEIGSRMMPGFRRIFPALVKLSSTMQEKIYEPAVVSASAVPCGHSRQKTRALRKGEIRKLVRQFVGAAVRAKEAGFDGVELHAAHGYLIQQFLSPAVNRRTDCYGGDFAGRTRFLREIIEGVRSACGKDYPLLVRLTVDEYDSGGRGIDLDEGIRIAKLVEDLGADAIDVSSGSYEQMNKWLEPVVYEPGWRKHLAAAVRAEVGIPVIAANLIRSAEQAAAQIAGGCQDFIGLGRPLLADPCLPEKIRTGREDEITRCIQCCRCFESLTENAWQGMPLQCSVNPRPSLSSDDLPDAAGKAVVIGAGPSGLQAAAALARRGVDVTVLERRKEPGGQLRLARRAPGKDKTGWCADDLAAEAVRAGVKIRCGCEPDAAAVAGEKPDGVIIATGALQLVPRLPGSELPHVFTCDRILSGEVLPPESDHIAVIGSGMTGLETAEYLVSLGRSVTVVEMAEQAGPGAYFQHLIEALSYLEERGCRILTGRRLAEIRKGEILLDRTDARAGCPESERLSADAVVFAVGIKPEDEVAVYIVPDGIPFRLIGDAGGIGRIAEAVSDGYKAACDWPDI